MKTLNPKPHVNYAEIKQADLSLAELSHAATLT
jgi:hypothetical protein